MGSMPGAPLSSPISAGKPCANTIVMLMPTPDTRSSRAS
jgi:hypothetical protein